MKSLLQASSSMPSTSPLPSTASTELLPGVTTKFIPPEVKEEVIIVSSTDTTLPADYNYTKDLESKANDFSHEQTSKSPDMAHVSVVVVGDVDPDNQVSDASPETLHSSLTIAGLLIRNLRLRYWWIPLPLVALSTRTEWVSISATCRDPSVALVRCHPDPSEVRRVVASVEVSQARGEVLQASVLPHLSYSKVGLNFVEHTLEIEIFVFCQPLMSSLGQETSPNLFSLNGRQDQR